MAEETKSRDGDRPRKRPISQTCDGEHTDSSQLLDVKQGMYDLTLEEHDLLSPMSAQEFWVRQYHDMNKLRRDLLNSDSTTYPVLQRGCIETIEAIPYLSLEIKNIVREMKELSTTGSNDGMTTLPPSDQMSLLSPEDQELVNALPTEELRKKLADVLREMGVKNHEQDREMKMIRRLDDDVHDYLVRAAEATTKVDRQLQTLSGLGEAEGTKGRKVGTNTQRAIEMMKKRRIEAQVAAGAKMPVETNKYKNCCDILNETHA